jgi:hypothetical protein
MHPKPFVLLPLPSEWMNDIQLEPLEPIQKDVKINEPALEKLKELAARAVSAANVRAALKARNGIESDVTSLTRTYNYLKQSTACPVPYKNPTLSPYLLLISAIFENRRHMNASVLPKAIYVSDTLLKQLPKDITYCIGEQFHGSIPFTQLDGTRVCIPIVSAKQTLDIMLPKDTVWCAN